MVVVGYISMFTEIKKHYWVMICVFSTLKMLWVLILKPFWIYFHGSITDKEEKCMFTDTWHSCFVYIIFCKQSFITSQSCGRPFWKCERFWKCVGGLLWSVSASWIKWSMGWFGDCFLEGWRRQERGFWLSVTFEHPEKMVNWLLVWPQSEFDTEPMD